MRRFLVCSLFACHILCTFGVVDPGTCVGDASCVDGVASRVEDDEIFDLQGVELLQKKIRLEGLDQQDPIAREATTNGMQATGEAFEHLYHDNFELDGILPKIQVSLAPFVPRSRDNVNYETAAIRVFEQIYQECQQVLRLSDEEVTNFRQRFVDVFEVVVNTVHWESPSDFMAEGSAVVETAKQYFKWQRPAVSENMIAEINSNVEHGWKASYQSWMKDMSMGDFAMRLGKLMPVGYNETLLLQAKRTAPSILLSLPDSFDSREKWPECGDLIGRVTNQGHCGSCWAFASMSVADSRLCIASNGTFNGAHAQLSRGYDTSCATPKGCDGGLSRFTFDLLANRGIPTEDCSPYFAEGAGTEHFQQSQQAPPCPNSCRTNYSRSLAADTFRLRGIGRYTELIYISSFSAAKAREAIYANGPISFGMYAGNTFMAYSSGIYKPRCYSLPNHEVVAFGWGRTGSQFYWLAQNSWGEDWGVGGRFQVVECGAFDLTIPGDLDILDQNEPPLPLLEPERGTSFVPDPNMKEHAPSEAKLRLPRRVEANPSGARITTRGCQCQTSWRTHNGELTCAGACCNPDHDKEGDWCLVLDATCEGRVWGYCSTESQI